MQSRRPPTSYRRHLVIDSDSSSDEENVSSDESQLDLSLTSSMSVLKKTAKPTSMAHPTEAAKQPRRDSIDSLLSNSSSSAEGYYQRANTISKKLLSRPSATIEFREKCCNDEVENENEDENVDRNCTKNNENDSLDPSSAWSQKNDSTDFFLSSGKRPDINWPELSLPKDLYEQLFSFQRQGVQWMASLHTVGIGGILGDDMGMGKTYVTLAYLGGLMRADTIRNALVICPVSVLQSWENEARKILPKCTSSVKITVISSDTMSKRRRLEVIESVAR